MEAIVCFMFTDVCYLVWFRAWRLLVCECNVVVFVIDLIRVHFAFDYVWVCLGICLWMLCFWFGVAVLCRLFVVLFDMFVFGFGCFSCVWCDLVAFGLLQFAWCLLLWVAMLVGFCLVVVCLVVLFLFALLFWLFMCFVVFLVGYVFVVGWFVIWLFVFVCLLLCLFRWMLVFVCDCLLFDCVYFVADCDLSWMGLCCFYYFVVFYFVLVAFCGVWFWIAWFVLLFHSLLWVDCGLFSVWLTCYGDY